MRTSGGARPKAIVFGIMFWYPLAGVTYQFLHYLIALRRLGFDPYYVEDSSRWVYDPRLGQISDDPTGNIGTVVPALRRHGFGDRWAFRARYDDERCFGLSCAQLAALYRDSDVLLNVTAAQDLLDEHLSVPHRIYVETDPFGVQVNEERGDPFTLEALAAHDAHFTFGENVGGEDCLIPLGRTRWLPTRQPVVLDLWDASFDGEGGAYTSVTNWHNKTKDIQYRGETYYWTKDREFLRFIDLPRHRSVPFELAVGPDATQVLEDNGWRTANGLNASSSIDAYRQYIERSRAEFTVARDQYVRPRTGWFSDRSACYLAAGRPVITQETGFSHVLPTGKGLLAFSTLDDVLEAVDAVESDYAAHSRAAREVAGDCFGAEQVVGSLLQRAGV